MEKETLDNKVKKIDENRNIILRAKESLETVNADIVKGSETTQVTRNFSGMKISGQENCLLRKAELQNRISSYQRKINKTKMKFSLKEICKLFIYQQVEKCRQENRKTGFNMEILPEDLKTYLGKNIVIENDRLNDSIYNDEIYGKCLMQ